MEQLRSILEHVGAMADLSDNETRGAQVLGLAGAAVVGGVWSLLRKRASGRARATIDLPEGTKATLTLGDKE